MAVAYIGHSHLRLLLFFFLVSGVRLCVFLLTPEYGSQHHNDDSTLSMDVGQTGMA